MRISSSVAAVGSLLIASCADESGARRVPVAPTPNPASQAATLTIVSGNEQHGKAGEQFADALTVRVADRMGAGVRDVPVYFRIADGWGGLGAIDGPGEQGVLTTTDAQGLASVTLDPYDVGRISVTAEVSGDQDSLVTFNSYATAVVVVFHSVRGYGNYAAFYGPCYCSRNINTLSVPIGTSVEWRSGDDEPYSVTSTATPPGGASFDSGILARQSRFRFVPTTAGSWQYRDTRSGLTATLIAK